MMAERVLYVSVSALITKVLLAMLELVPAGEAKLTSSTPLRGSFIRDYEHEYHSKESELPLRLRD